MDTKSLTLKNQLTSCYNTLLISLSKDKIIKSFSRDFVKAIINRFGILRKCLQTLIQECSKVFIRLGVVK